jgi:hypothetical protein
MPQLPVTLHNTSAYERSPMVRGRKLWNALPKEWLLNDSSYPRFYVKIKKWIVTKTMILRNADFSRLAFDGVDRDNTCKKPLSYNIDPTLFES